jgi:Coenzyme PQQ synthesis protein D (PqqD)
MTTDTVPRRHERYSVEWMDNESLIYRAPSKTAIYLNETATVIWKLCDGTRTVAEIIDLLVGAFPDSACEVRVDVQETIEELVRSGALQLRPRRQEGTNAAADPGSTGSAPSS